MQRLILSLENFNVVKSEILLTKLNGFLQETIMEKKSKLFSLQVQLIQDSRTMVTSMYYQIQLEL